jgi:hypothetical protein
MVVDLTNQGTLDLIGRPRMEGLLNGTSCPGDYVHANKELEIILLFHLINIIWSYAVQLGLHVVNRFPFDSCSWRSPLVSSSVRYPGSLAS